MKGSCGRTWNLIRQIWWFIWMYLPYLSYYYIFYFSFLIYLSFLLFFYSISFTSFLLGGWSSHPADLLLPPSPPLISSPPFNSHHLRLRLSDSPPFLVPPRHEPPSRGHLRRCRCLEGCVQIACRRSSL